MNDKQRYNLWNDSKIIYKNVEVLCIVYIINNNKQYLQVKNLWVITIGL